MRHAITRAAMLALLVTLPALLTAPPAGADPVPAQAPIPLFRGIPPTPGGVVLPAMINLRPGRLARLECLTSGEIVRWINPSPNLDLIPIDGGRMVILSSPVAGTYPVYAYTALGGIPTEAAVCQVVVSDQPIPPGPVPPVPPGPVPPDPVPPGPPPGPSPIPVEGFRVIIVYETGEVQKIPAAQATILYSKTVRDYLDAKCVMGPDAKTREWRIWDKDVDATGESKLWQDVLKRPRKETPWLVISTGKGGYEGGLPSSVDAMMNLLKKYGGP